jgi:hypothetical protein
MVKIKHGTFWPREPDSKGEQQVKKGEGKERKLSKKKI